MRLGKKKVVTTASSVLFGVKWIKRDKTDDYFECTYKNHVISIKYPLDEKKTPRGVLQELSTDDFLGTLRNL